MKINEEFKGLKFDGIQLLRAISALLVAFYHVDFVYNMGINTAIGVDIFFVISGFIIMYTTQKGIKDYGKKRIIKIVPLYWILTIITFFAALLISGIVPYKPTITELLKSLFFIPYTRDGIRALDVTRPIVGPAHTLLNEMFFYLIFGISAKINHKRRGEITSCFLIILIIIGKIFDVSNIAPLRVWTSERMIEFVFGIILFYISKYIFNKNEFKIGKKKSLILTTISSIMIIVMIFVTNMNILLKATLSTVIVLGFSISFLSDLKAPKYLLTIGNMSYSFYLIHYYVILIFKKFINPMKDIRNNTNSLCNLCNSNCFNYFIYFI